MTEDEAKEELALRVTATEDPELDDDQLVSCLRFARRPDSEDRDYTDADWDPVWDLDAACAEAWRRKAGIAANRFNFAEDSQRFDRAQIYAHCIAMADQYARRSMGAIPTS